MCSEPANVLHLQLEQQQMLWQEQQQELVVGNSLERAAATLTGDAPAETAMETTEVSVGSTAVTVGNESAGAAAEETTLVGKLSRKQAKNLKQTNEQNESHVLSFNLSACIDGRKCQLVRHSLVGIPVYILIS